MEIYNKFILSVILFIVSFIFTYVIRKIAIKKSIIDIPNERSSHTVPTPRGGGLAIVISWYIGITYLFINNSIDTSLFYGLLSGLILVVVGILDDIYSLSPIIRLIAQSTTAVLALYFLGNLQSLDLGFYIIKTSYLLFPIAFIGIIWFINLFNFLDGIDGYISTEVIFISLILFILTNSLAPLILVVAILGFLPFNWQKAKIFMGDVGSTLLGFNVAVFFIYYQNVGQISIIISLILSSVFWFDATLTLSRRWKNKERLSVAHKKHAYQRIVQAGYSHQKTVFYSIMLNVVGLIFVYLCIKFPEYSIVFFIIDILFLYFFVKAIDMKKPFI